MKPTVPTRQHAVNIAAPPPPRTPAGDAFSALLGQVIGLTRRFTTVGEALAKPAGQTLARWLVLDGLAVYQETPAHRRAKLVQLTPQGRTALRTIQTAQRAWADALGAKIGEADLRQASVVLDRVLRAVSGDRGPGGGGRGPAGGPPRLR